MQEAKSQPFHRLSRLRPWDFSSLDVFCGRLLDQSFETMEQWAYRNLWPMIEQARERKVIAEPVGVILERSGGALRFPEDRNVLIEVDAWHIKKRVFLFECKLYRCGKGEPERFATVFVPMMQCRIEDHETRAAVPEPLSEVYLGRIDEFDRDRAIVNRYKRDVRKLESADWAGPVVYERSVIPEMCEFTDMAAFMNHAGPIVSEGREVLLGSLKAEDRGRYEEMARSLACPMRSLILDIKDPLWLREPMEIRVRSCRSGNSFYFDYEVRSVRLKRLCERMLVAYEPVGAPAS